MTDTPLGKIGNRIIEGAKALGAIPPDTAITGTIDGTGERVKLSPDFSDQHEADVQMLIDNLEAERTCLTVQTGDHFADANARAQLVIVDAQLLILRTLQTMWAYQSE